jgi:tetratricopeptide (TPR) repeat protein
VPAVPPQPGVAPGIAALRARGEELAAARRFDEAIGCFQQIVDVVPLDASALLQLSYLHSLAGRYREGRRYALLAHAAGPRQPDAIVELMARLRTFNEPAAILENARRVGKLDKVSIPLLLQFAQILSFLNLQGEALRFLDEAARADPDYPPTLSARSQVLTYLGRFDEAEQMLLRCTRRAPAFAQPHWLLSRLRTWTPERNHLDTLARELARPGRTADDVVLLSYAAHKEFDDLGRHAEAWEALDRACRMRRAAIAYDAAESEALFRELEAMPVVAPPADVVAAPPANGIVPVFIVGMHRSGTTLLEQVLAGNDRVRDMGELYDFTSCMRLATDHHCRGVVDRQIVRRAPGLDFGAIGRAYMAGVDWRRAGRDVLVDKLPSNFLNLGFILRALPQARVLHMVRDPMETCFSNLRELFSDANPYSYDQVELADYYARYARLMAHWRERFPGRILDVQYDRLVGDSEPEVRRTAAFCGLEFQDAMLHPGSGRRAVATASAVQVRGGIRRRDVAKWRAYEAQLQPLRARLEASGVALAATSPQAP